MDSTLKLERHRPLKQLFRFKGCIRFKDLAAVLLCGTCIAFSSIGHADNDDLLAKLDKLGYQQGETVERIEHYRVDGWNYLDNQHIMIYAGPSKRFLITTLIDCPDLNFAENIGFTSTASYLTKLDKLIVRGTGGIVQNCPISEIRTLQKVGAKS